MQCVPVCKVCSGLCRQVAPERPASKATARRTFPLPGYIHLVCDHYTTPEETRLHKPYKRHGVIRYWCEKCGRRRARKPAPKPEQKEGTLF